MGRTVDGGNVAAMRARPIPLLLVVVIALCAACGASSREKTLRASVVAMNATRDVFIAFDHDHKRAILAKHPTREPYEAEIGEWERERAPVMEAQVLGYRAIGVALAIESDQASLDVALAAVQKFRAAVNDLINGATP